MTFILRRVFFLLLWMPFNISAAVQVTCFDPPLPISALADVPGPGPNVIAVDFDADGNVDFNLLFGCCGGIDAYFNGPARIVVARQLYPGITNVYGSLGALPLGTVIGSNLITSADTNRYVWHTGDTNSSDDTQAYGDHKTIVLTVLNSGVIGQPLVVGGDPADKEGVMAVEFLIGTNVHYGYIHFDFRREIGWYGGCGGYILGWAYETEANKPIVAAPIAVPPTPFLLGLQKQSEGVFDLSWRATPGATYRVQAAPTIEVPFMDFTPDIVPLGGSDASPLIELVPFHGLQDSPTYFWRVVRIH